MANVSYGDMVVELKGRSSGKVYQKTKFGYIQRKRVKPSNPNTPLQQATRRAIPTLNRQWSTLTETQRLNWFAAAVYPATGASDFISRNFDLLKYNMQQITDPTYTPVPDTPGDPGLNGSASNPLVHLTYTILKGSVTFDIDWSDGTIESFPLASVFDVSHQYAGSPNVDIFPIISDKSFPWTFSSNQGTSLTQFQIGAPNIIGLDLSGELFATAEVNSLLISLDALGTFFGSVDLSGQTPAAPPSGAGITALNNLIAKGWITSVD